MSTSDAPSATEGTAVTDVTQADVDALALRHRLVAATSDFATAYLRWVDAHTCDGLSYPRLRLLETLHCKGPAMMRALGEQLGQSPRNMTALVDALEQEGLVIRRRHPTDRRAVLVELTAAGLQAAEATLEPRVAAISAPFDALPESERLRLAAALERLIDDLRERNRRG